MTTYTPSDAPRGERVGSLEEFDEAVLCAIVAREWRWRRSAVAEVALGPSTGPRRWRLHGSASAVWIIDDQIAPSLRSVEERIKRAERAAHALLAADTAATRAAHLAGADARRSGTALGRVTFARETYAAALEHWRSAEHPECLRAQARLLEAHVAESQRLAAEPGAPDPERDDLRIAALRRRWEVAERSERATAQARALAFRALVQAATGALEAEIRIHRVGGVSSPN